MRPRHGSSRRTGPPSPTEWEVELKGCPSPAYNNLVFKWDSKTSQFNQLQSGNFVEMRIGKNMIDMLHENFKKVEGYYIEQILRDEESKFNMLFWLSCLFLCCVCFVIWQVEHVKNKYLNRGKMLDQVLVEWLISVKETGNHSMAVKMSPMGMWFVITDPTLPDKTPPTENPIDAGGNGAQPPYFGTNQQVEIMGFPPPVVGIYQGQG